MAQQFVALFELEERQVHAENLFHQLVVAIVLGESQVEVVRDNANQIENDQAGLRGQIRLQQGRHSIGFQTFFSGHLEALDCRIRNQSQIIGGQRQIGRHSNRQRVRSVR